MGSFTRIKVWAQADKSITVHWPEALTGILHAETIMGETSISALVWGWIEERLDLATG